MALFSTTKAAFVRETLSYINVRGLNRLNGRQRLSEVLSRVQRLEVVSAHQKMVAYAIVWSLESLRLNMEPEQALLSMNTRQLVGLVYDLSKACKTQIEVTYRLNAMYAQKAA